jgi:hypothetical protein
MANSYEHLEGLSAKDPQPGRKVKFATQAQLLVRTRTVVCHHRNDQFSRAASLLHFYCRRLAQGFLVPQVRG